MSRRIVPESLPTVAAPNSRLTVPPPQEGVSLDQRIAAATEALYPRLGAAVRGMYPDNSLEAYGRVSNFPGYRHLRPFPTSDRSRGENYLAAQRQRAQRYHEDFMDEQIERQVGDRDEAQLIRYRGPGLPLRHDLYPVDFTEFVDEWFAPSAVYGRRHGLDNNLLHLDPTRPGVDEGPREIRPRRERSPEAGGD